jgi:hypothetical protein
MKVPQPIRFAHPAQVFRDSFAPLLFFYNPRGHWWQTTHETRVAELLAERWTLVVSSVWLDATAAVGGSLFPSVRAQVGKARTYDS